MAFRLKTLTSAVAATAVGGVPFISHDNTPARTHNVEEVFPERANDPITSFTWAELQQLDAGPYFDEKFTGERIPHIDDAVKIATAQTGVYIEIKSPKNSPGIEQVVADALLNNLEWKRLVDADKIQVLGFDEASNRTFLPPLPRRLNCSSPGESAHWSRPFSGHVQSCPMDRTDRWADF